MKKVVKSKSGAIILRQADHSNQVLLLYRGNHDDWSFPKGHVEPDEELEAAMRREIAEETGLNVKLVKQLPAMHYTKKSTDTLEEITCHMYLVEPIGGKLKVEHEWDKLEWVDVDKAQNLLTYPNIKDYYALVIKELEE